MRAERHENALGRSELLTCLQCGYAGRKLDRRRGLELVDIVLVPLLAAIGFGIPVIFLVMRMRTPACPACRAGAKDLRPEEAVTPSPEGDRIWRAAEASERRRLTRHMLGVLLALLGAGAAFLGIVR